MPKLKLTKTAIEAIDAPDPSGRQVIYWDTAERGFGVLVSGVTSTKTYIAQRRLKGDGRTRRLTVGNVKDFGKVEEAREKAHRLLAELGQGRDPKEEERRAKEEQRRAKAANRSLRDWFDLYLDRNRGLRQGTVEEYRRSMRHLEPWLDRPMREITRDMVEERHAMIGKSSGPGAANSAMRVLRLTWNFAVDRDESIPRNPVRLRKDEWFKTPARTRRVRGEELRAFYSALDELPNRTAADYLKLLLFTGLRRREAAALRWDDVDFVERVIRFPASRVKGDRKFDLPMSDVVLELLIVRRRLGDDGGWVFPANSRSGHLEEPKFALDLVAEMTGIAVSAHDLRRTFVTTAEAIDLSPYALKALVNHALPENDVTAGYIGMEALRERAQRVADRLKHLCAVDDVAGGNVAKLAS